MTDEPPHTSCDPYASPADPDWCPYCSEGTMDMDPTEAPTKLITRVTDHTLSNGAPMKVLSFEYPPPTVYMYEVLVPTMKPDHWPGKRRHIRTRFHRTWDEKVRAIAGGLTILHPGKGQWVADSGRVYVERMIPVRIACTPDEMDKILKMTADHYEQEAVMAYRISEEVLLYHRDDA